MTLEERAEQFADNIGGLIFHSLRSSRMTIQELSDEMRKERARCSTHCGTWNSEDKDCEIYGEQHCPPSKCRYFLAIELERRNKEIEK